MTFLPFLAVMALFLKWKYASPYLPSPTLARGPALAKNLPLILFVLAGILMSVAMGVSPGHDVMVIALLCVAVSLMIGAIAIAFV
jgi:hypothetical protein